MLRLVVMVACVLIVIAAVSMRLMPHGTAAETVTPQQVHFRLHSDDKLVAKP